MEKNRYRVLRAGFLHGTYRREGEEIELFEKQAQVDLPPLGSRLAEMSVKTTKPAAAKSKASSLKAG
ncbi:MULTISPECIES: hypothetical protein [unclassified Pseudovibrio]|uniref:hypothetical protein n=1 Tax=unclassified Pseudovibrio TaxID=2627060 RepID=UPI0007AEA6D7|nr:MULTISPECIES: hypothetical protein [unclassified Pseudovibrio]KZK95059.1 hypothetical protein PsW74_04321 [Pseudovibrio sp. W74]KZL08861.1 hypothetical protein PsAD14_02806 [Pseudovibrio sp. Ad14]